MTLRSAAALLLLPILASAQFGIRYKRPGFDAGVTPAMEADAWKAYQSGLAHACPRQRISLQSPAQLSLQLQDFRRTMSPPQTTRYASIAQQLCKPDENSAQCSNTAMLVTAKESKVLTRFIDTECASGTVCTTAGHCQVHARR